MKPELVADLKRLGDCGEGALLQVLVSRFELVRRLAGLDLVIEIDDELPVITSGEEKRKLAERLDPREGADFLQVIEEFRRAAPGTSLELSFERFAFRHASAGVLPLVGPEARPLLFRRDIHPVGWNVANGGSTARRELVEVESLMRREALEEILFLDQKRGLIRALAGAEEMSEARLALKLWRQRLGAGVGRPLEHRFREGPDRLLVRDHGRETATEEVKICFDVAGFGLEILRFLEIDDQGVLLPLDGEILAGRLLDRPTAIFADLGALRRCRPEQSFHGGRARTARRPLRSPLCPVTIAMLGGEVAPGG